MVTPIKGFEMVPELHVLPTGTSFDNYPTFRPEKTVYHTAYSGEFRLSNPGQIC